MNERLQARVDKIQREIARRETALTTSERQARQILGTGREDVDDEEVMPGRRISSKPRRRVVEDQGGDSTARTQARQIIAGSRRLPSRSWTSEEES